MEIRYLNIANYGEITYFINACYNKEYEMVASSIKENMLAISSQTKVIKVFKMLGLEEKILDKNVDVLTSLEEKLLIIAIQLLKGKHLVLNYLEKGLNEKERIYLKRIVKKLAHDYKVKVIVFTNDLEFLLNFVDKIIILNNDDIKKEFTKKDLYEEEIYHYVDKPAIISFINKCQALGKKIDNYTDVSEVLKGLYRL